MIEIGSNGTDVVIVKLRYKLDSDVDLNKLTECSSCFLNSEQELSLNHAASEIEVEFEIDRAWGFMRPISLNGHRLA